MQRTYLNEPIVFFFFPQILKADDKELNQWSSLKKTCMFRYGLGRGVLSLRTPLLHDALLCPATLCCLRSDKEEHIDLKNYKIKSQNGMKKRKILSSVYLE